MSAAPAVTHEPDFRAEVEPEAVPWVRDPDRIDPGIVSLRRHAARGTVINSAFNVGLYGLGALQRVVVAIWLTRTQYGMWGILLAALFSLTFIKQFGVADKYIQQSDADQEVAFQKAFTLELCLSGAFFLLACLALPVYAVAYGRPQILIPGIVLALAMPLTAFEAPAWIPYRRMQYARQRVLTSIDPVTTILLSIVLTASGLGYWGLIIGALGGSLLGAVVCTASSPYRFRLRLDWETVKSYSSFSLPLFGLGLCGFLTLQGTVFVANRAVGLAGLGAIGLAGNIAGVADGVDGIVSQTVYPVICAVSHRLAALAEAFVKSNRIALMWAMPAMVGVALFAGDLVPVVFGARWRPAVPLITVIALTTGVAQVGFNWSMFYRAVGNTRPIFAAALAEVLVFLAVSVPAILLLGLTGYAVGVASVTVSQVALRGYYMRRLFGDFSPLRQLIRAVLPTVPAAAIVLAVRYLAPGRHSLVRVLAEVGLYATAALVATFVFERPLVNELLGYLRRAKSPASTLGSGAAPQASEV